MQQRVKYLHIHLIEDKLIMYRSFFVRCSCTQIFQLIIFLRNDDRKSIQAVCVIDSVWHHL